MEASSLIDRLMGAGGWAARAVLGTSVLLPSASLASGLGVGHGWPLAEVVVNESLAVPGACRPSSCAP